MTSQAVSPPGRAIVTLCPDCNAGIDGGETCLECDGSGRQVWRVCPACGDLGWAYTNGLNDQSGMICALGCGYRWYADDPGWQAQRLPS